MNIEMNQWERLHALHDNWEPAQQVFFDAMLEGYATNESSHSVFTEKRGGTERRSWPIGAPKGPWLVLDEWETTSTSDYSGGTTVIFYEGKLVWMMHYFGYYTREAIPILKTALRQAYTHRSFQGGRGPSRFVCADGEYTNSAQGQFTSFSGREEIRFVNGSYGGYHVYHGGLMIRTPRA